MCILPPQNQLQKNRAFKHYRYDDGARKANCPGAPEVVIARFCTCGDVVPKRMMHMEMYNLNDASAATATPCSSESM